MFLSRFILPLAILVSMANSSTLSDLNRLLSNKTAGYNKSARPIMNQSNPTIVYIGFEFLGIREFDEVNERLSATSFLTLAWNDEVMTWDPEEYGGLSYVVVESSNVWKPNLMLTNPAGKLEKVGNDWQPIRIMHYGLAFMNPVEVFESSCGIDVSFYPWDEQICYFFFVPAGLSSHEITFVLNSNKIGTSYAANHGMWKIVDSRALFYQDSNNTPILYFALKLQRLSDFVVVNVLLPVALMSVLNVLIFLIPSDCGEKFSYCLTVLLSITVFMTIIGENLPKRSTPMCLLNYYVVGILVNSVGIVLATIASSRMYFRDKDVPVPPLWRFFVFVLSCRCMCRKPLKRGKIMPNGSTNKWQSSGRAVTSEALDVDSPASGNLHTNEGGIHPSNSYLQEQNTHVQNAALSEREKNERNVCWKDVSNSLDKFFFICFTACLTIMTILFAVRVKNRGTTAFYMASGDEYGH